jgi:hypothetical protein
MLLLLLQLSVCAFPLLPTDYCLSFYFPLLSCQCHFLVVKRFYCFSIFLLLLYSSFSPLAPHSFLSFLILLLSHFPNFPAPSNSKLQKHLFIFLPCTPVYFAFLPTKNNNNTTSCTYTLFWQCIQSAAERRQVA